jgi:hypothetical protein
MGVNDELERPVWNVMVVACFKGTIPSFTWRSEKNHE